MATLKNDFLTFPRSAKLYLVSEFLISGYYTWPFWYGYASQRITAAQFGVYLAVTYIVGLLSEVPTGAFADRFGRKRSAIIGALLSALPPIIVLRQGSFSAYIIAACIVGIGGAFVSGSLESLVHDLSDMTKDLYRKIMVQETFFYQAGLIVSSLTGGFMYSLNRSIPFYAQFISFIFAAVLISRISSDGEVLQYKTINHSHHGARVAVYLRSLKKGFLHLFTIKAIQPLIVFGCTLSVLMWMGIEYINEAAMIHYDLQPNVRGLLIAGAKLVTLVILNTIVLRRLTKDSQKLNYLMLLTGIVFTLYSFGIKALFLTGFLGFNLISSINSNFIRPILHDHIDKQWRATAISAYSFAANLAQAFASVIIGYLLQKQGVVFVQRILLLVFVVVAVPMLMRYLAKEANSNK